MITFIDLKDFAPKFLNKSVEALKTNKISKEELSIITKSNIQNIALLERHPLSFCCGGWRETDKRFVRPQFRESIFIEEINLLKDNAELVTILKKIFETDSIQFLNATVTI